MSNLKMILTKKIINTTKNTTLAETAEIANTPLKRLIGLLGRKGLETDQGLIIMPCNSIHTFFMRFAIDVVFLDKNMQVVAISQALPPTRLFFAPLRSRLVIELPRGTIKRTNTQLKDIISIK